MALYSGAVALISLPMSLALDCIHMYSNQHLAFQFCKAGRANDDAILAIPNVGLLAQESDIPDVSHIEAAVHRAMLKTSYLRLRIADSSAATAFAICFSVCAAVTTSLHCSGTLSTYAI